MKFLIAIFFFTLPLYAKNCPQEITVAIRCAPSLKEFQLIDHLGKYIDPRMESNPQNNLLICSYRPMEWRSEYRYHDQDIEKTIRVSSLRGLADVVRLIDSIGFKVDHFGANSHPFATLIFKTKGNKLILDQMFLFSGLESTFDNNSNFSVHALDKKKFSTVVINERYLKSEDAAADTFVTGSNCSVAIR